MTNLEKKQLIIKIKNDYNTDSLESLDEWEDKIIDANMLVIGDFKLHLENKGLAKKTISHHINNIDMFANYYLTTYDYCGTIFDGYKNFNDFFGYWFITKCLFASENSMKSLISSLKKFYTFLYEEKYINKDEMDDAIFSLNEGKEGWLDDLNTYITNPSDYYSI